MNGHVALWAFPRGGFGELARRMVSYESADLIRSLIAITMNKESG